MNQLELPLEDRPSGRPAGTATRWSVRTFLVLLIFACLLPGVIGATALFVREYREGHAQLKKDTLQLARALTQTVDSQLLRAQTLAQTLATDDSLAKGDFARFYRQARKALAVSGVGVSVVLCDETGEQIVNTAVEFGAPLPHNDHQKDIRRALATGQPVFAGLFFGKILGGPVTAVIVPVVVGGKVAYTVGVAILPEHFSAILRSQDLPPEWMAMILDDAGKAVAHTPAAAHLGDSEAMAERLQQLMSSSRESGEVAAGDDPALIAVQSRSSITNWRVGLGIPPLALEEKLRRTLAMLALGVAALFGICLGFAWFIGGRIARSIQGLSIPATALVTGEARPVPELHVKEAAEVANAMAVAAGLLQARTRSLEKTNAALAAREAELVEGQRLARFGSWSWDPRTDELRMSRELRQLYGWEALHFKELRGTLITVETWECLNARLQETLRTGIGYAMDMEVFHDSGVVTWIHVKGEAVRGPNGDVVAVHGILQDISERRQAQMVLQESEVRFQATFDQAAVGMAHISLDGRWLRINDRLCTIVGYGREDLLQSTFQDITHADDLEESLALGRRLVAGDIPNYSSERRYVRRDGSLVWVNVTVSLVRRPDGLPDYFIGVVEDIQPRREAEAALDKARASHLQYLEQQVAERTAALTAANKELQAFTYAASHDLKSPLGRINNFSTLLEKRYRERLEGDGLLFLKFIRTNATRMTILINDMLAHAQVEQQARNLQRIALGEAVQSILNEKAADIQDCRAEISVDLPDLGVSADAVAFSQVLRNLVENALKYSSRANPPRIRIGAAAAGSRCRLWVQDNGVGFDMAHHDKIFEIFYRLHTFDQFPGSGIGLALVKKAMESMHGRVWAESEPGQGSVFFLELQLWPQAAPADAPAPLAATA